MSPLHLFIGGLISTLAFALAAIRWLGPRGWMDVPEGRKTHGHPVPRTGGAALWGGVLVGQAMGWLGLPITTTEWICLHGLALLGFLDDRFSLRPAAKAFVGLAIAIALAVSAAHLFVAEHPSVVLMSIPIPTDPPWIVIGLLVLWFWALPQSFNLIDGMDGLVLGFSLCILLSLRIGLRSGSGTFLLGALLAVFVLNWPNARHFLGDCGAYFIGGLLGLVALKTKAFAYPSHALWIFAYPILDTTLVVLTRLFLRRPLGQGDRNHFHHHWAELLGRRGRWAVPILWTLGAAMAMRPQHFPGSGIIAWLAFWFMIISGTIFAIQTCLKREPPPGMG